MLVDMRQVNSHFFLNVLSIFLLIVLVYAPQAEPGGAVELRVQQCDAEEREATQNNYVDACDGAYPSTCNTNNDLLSCNDGLAEDQQIRNGEYSGVRVNIRNTGVTDCGSIDSVFLCYEWWVQNNPSFSYDCLVAVDADGGASYSTVTTTCPGDTANPGITCVDVTSLESWNCGTFFGAGATGALARNEFSTTKQPKLFTDALFFNVSYSPPAFVDTSIDASTLNFGTWDPGTNDHSATENPITLTNTNNSNTAVDVYLNNTQMTSGGNTMPCSSLSVNTDDILPALKDGVSNGLEKRT